MDGELKIPGDSPAYLAHVDVSEKLTHQCGISIRTAKTFEAGFQVSHPHSSSLAVAAENLDAEQVTGY